MQTQLSDGFVSLRRYRKEDIPLLYAAVTESRNELVPWMPWCNAKYSLDDTTAFVSSRDAEWAAGDDFCFAIFDARDGSYLGGTGMNQVNHIDKCANLGYWVRTNKARCGVASAAARLTAQFGLRELAFNRLDILVACGNHASLRVAEKVGAQREGVLRKRLWLHGVASDAILYSLVAGDFNP